MITKQTQPTYILQVLTRITNGFRVCAEQRAGGQADALNIGASGIPKNKQSAATASDRRMLNNKVYTLSLIHI